MANQLNEAIHQILSNYLQTKTAPFTKNKLASFIRNDIPKRIIKNVVSSTENLKFSGSCGMSQWSEVPWIAVLDKRITSTTQEGFYVVYLFQADMKGVYLSLNQGWEFFKSIYGAKEGEKEIRFVSQQYQKKLQMLLQDSSLFSNGFSFSPILLNNQNSNTDLPKGYELGHIYGKYYPVEVILNQTTLVQDLKHILSVYNNLVNDDVAELLTTDSISSDIEEIDNNSSLTTTQKQQLRNARIGQGKYRRELLSLYSQCPVTQVQLRTLLKASHIKPWQVSNNIERLDKYNGLILAAHVDALFDAGYISFSDDGDLLISTQHNTEQEIIRLNINKEVKIKIYEKSKPYLDWHRRKIFKP
ncbi:MrcB family domain-containing protein [Neisseria sp. Ec49-e6-T10]|uniref:MrcB family domain-containing protein n=1 Tax=Neisseria sp. Ec49-e6-T10 TaxID=3140744 RepID=UPI003EBEA3D9